MTQKRLPMAVLSQLGYNLGVISCTLLGVLSAVMAVNSRFAILTGIEIDDRYLP